MNPIPFLGLAMVAGGYFAATGQLDEHFRTLPGTPPPQEISAWPAAQRPAIGGTPSIYDMPGHVPAYAEPHCEATATLAATLDHDFAETPVETRIAADGLVFDLYASPLMGTWTLVHRGADGIACIVSSGTGWADGTDPDHVFSAADLSS